MPCHYHYFFIRATLYAIISMPPLFMLSRCRRYYGAYVVFSAAITATILRLSAPWLAHMTPDGAVYFYACYYAPLTILFDYYAMLRAISLKIFRLFRV